jgi:nucleoside recognition membrane protein YjiH
MSRSVLRLLVFSTLGIIAFFVPLTIGGKTTILLDHIVTFLTTDIKKLSHTITFSFLLAGGVLPLVNSDWRKGPLELILVVLKLLAIPIGALYLLGSGPAFLMAPDLVPFLFEKLVMPVGLIVPIGAIFLSFLVGYGLLEFVGVLLEPIMRPIWKIPGRAAIDAVASFTGSYSVGLLITNRVYKEGKYSAKEATIIATGFSTVSATFMLIVAKTLGLMGIWNFYFGSTLLITFAVSAVSVRLWPLTKLSTAVQMPLEPADQYSTPSLPRRS